MTHRRRPDAWFALTLASVAIGASALGTAIWYRPAASAAPLSTAQVAGWIGAADRLESRYVDDAWCGPLLDRSVGTAVTWPARLATPQAGAALAIGPPRGRVPHPAGPTSAALDLSDARAVLPGGDRPWILNPGFCLSQAGYPRLVTTGGRRAASYPPLPHHLRSLDQIFDRFPAYLGSVRQVNVPLAMEVTYSLSVGGGPVLHYHLWWNCALGMQPTGHGYGLRLSSWDVGAGAALAGVASDFPPGPVYVHPDAPGGGP